MKNLWRIVEEFTQGRMTFRQFHSEFHNWIEENPELMSIEELEHKNVPQSAAGFLD